MFARNRWLLASIGVIIWSCAASTASAALLINLGGNEFSGSGANAIADDAITLLFEDSSDDGTLDSGVVRLTIKFNGGTGVDAEAKIKEITFNGESAVVTYLDGSAGTPQPFIQSQTGPPGPGAGYTSDGDRFYDFQILFPTESGSSFDVGETSRYLITGAGITAETFNQLADPSNKGPFYAAAHINAVDSGNSGHYGAGETLTPPPRIDEPLPEPMTLAIWAGLGGVGLLLGRRKLVVAS